jgi:ribosomal-protein-alanine N-acetyltransferase
MPCHSVCPTFSSVMTAAGREARHCWRGSIQRHIPSARPVPLAAPSPIESERLILRLVAEPDLPALLDVNSSEEVTAMLPYARWETLADAKAWYQRMRGIQDTGLALQFVVVSKSEGLAIGTCLLFRFEEGSARAELGYVLGRAYWGKGLMREALEALISCAFGGMGLRRLEAEVDTRNLPSARLLQRLGFTKEGLLRQRWVAKGEAKDVEMYSLLRSEWPVSTRDSG